MENIIMECERIKREAELNNIILKANIEKLQSEIRLLQIQNALSNCEKFIVK